MMPLSIAKDILEGTEGVIEGWVDLEQRQVLLTVIMDLPSGAKQSITKDTYTRNLKLTREYRDIKGAHADLGEEQQTRPGAASSAKADPSQCLEWALGIRRIFSQERAFFQYLVGRI